MGGESGSHGRGREERQTLDANSVRRQGLDTETAADAARRERPWTDNRLVARRRMGQGFL